MFVYGGKESKGDTRKDGQESYAETKKERNGSVEVRNVQTGGGGRREIF
jgi:hypothetical protein